MQYRLFNRIGKYYLDSQVSDSKQNILNYLERTVPVNQWDEFEVHELVYDGTAFTAFNMHRVTSETVHKAVTY